MSTETIRDPETADTGAVSTTETGPASTPEAGSAWWAELFIGTVCWVVAAVFALSHTAVGPFASLTVVYSPVVAAAYCVAAVAFGAAFLQSGLQRSPFVVDL